MRDTGLVTGYWPALDHISKPSAGSYHPDAIWSYSQRFIGRAAYIALLYERPPYSESGASLRAAVCGTAAPSLIPHYALCIPNSAYPSPLNV